ncbi:hypothetical protein C8R44DRAFT_892395 [Mycena epipterygia]|nr:hypothetical protein C8R44DRAFT_892395 [Mycena epipterygia]
MLPATSELPVAFYSVLYAPQLASSGTPPCTFCSRCRLVVRCPRTLPASYYAREVDTSLDGAQSPGHRGLGERVRQCTRPCCHSVRPTLAHNGSPRADPDAHDHRAHTTPRDNDSPPYHCASILPHRLAPSPASHAQSRAHPSSWKHAPPRAKWHGASHAALLHISSDLTWHHLLQTLLRAPASTFVAPSPSSPPHAGRPRPVSTYVRSVCRAAVAMANDNGGTEKFRCVCCSPFLFSSFSSSYLPASSFPSTASQFLPLSLTRRGRTLEAP